MEMRSIYAGAAERGMNMNNITFSPGTLYMGSPDGEMNSIGEVKETNFYDPVTDAAGVPIHETLTRSETTRTITLTQNQVNALFDAIYDMRGKVINLVREKGYPRIAHLISHARKSRTRKKNLFRAYRILEREE